MASITRRNQPTFGAKVSQAYKSGEYCGYLLNDAGVTVNASKRVGRNSMSGIRHPITRDGRKWAIGKDEKPQSIVTLRRQGKMLAKAVERNEDPEKHRWGRRVA